MPQHIAKQIKQGPTQHGGNVHHRVEQCKCKTTIAVCRVAFDSNGHDRNAQGFCNGCWAQERGHQGGAGCGERNDRACCCTQAEACNETESNACIIYDGTHKKAKDCQQGAL